MNTPSITKISILHLPMISKDTFEILVNRSNHNGTQHKVIVQVLQKNYELERNTLKVKLPIATPANSHPLQSQLKGNDSLRVKAFLYDIVTDKVIEAKLQEFSMPIPKQSSTPSATARITTVQNPITVLEYKPNDYLLQTVPVILGWEKSKKVKIKNSNINNKLDLNFNLAYETDGHYSTVYLICLMLGMDNEFAKKLATATEAPDTTIHSETKFELNDTWGHVDGSQQEIHSLTGGFHGIEEFFTAIKFLYTPNENIKQLGEFLHRFGDTYAHTEINNLKPDDIKEDLDLIDANNETIQNYINSWKIKTEKSLKSNVEPWVKFFNYYLKKYGLTFLNDETKQIEIFKGKTLKQALKDIYLVNESKDYIMYGNTLFTSDEHAFTDGGYPDMIYFRPNWYRLYVQNLTWLLSTKFKLDKFKFDLLIFDRMINFISLYKCSMKGIIDYEIAKKQGKKEIYIPVFYADGRILASGDSLKNDYLQIAKDIVEKTKKYILGQGDSIYKVEEIYGNINKINKNGTFNTEAFKLTVN